MRRAIFLLLAILIACTPVTTPPVQESLCKTPYFEWKKGECCLDKNSNQICDNEERIEPVQISESKPIEQNEASAPQSDQPEAAPIIETSKTQLQELLEKAPTNYKYGIKDATVIVVGNLRRIITPLETKTDRPMIFDKNGKVLYIPYGDISAKWWADHKQLAAPTGVDASTKKLPAYFEIRLTGNKLADQANLPKDEKGQLLVNKLLLDAYYDSPGPVEFIEAYKSEPLLKTDTTARQIATTRTQSKLSLYYQSKDVPDKVLAFRIDANTQLPLLIEELNQQDIVTKKYEYIFDKSVEEDQVNFPKEYIIVTEYDAQKYEKFLKEQGKSGGETYNINIYV
jgi:hypothetical protein